MSLFKTNDNGGLRPKGLFSDDGDGTWWPEDVLSGLLYTCGSLGGDGCTPAVVHGRHELGEDKGEKDRVRRERGSW